jgi:hypothetical protein
MARVIQFCTRQMYQGNVGSSGVYYSEIVDVTDASRIDLELRMTAMSGTTPTAVALIETTSDPTFDNNSWLPASGTALSASAITTGYQGPFSGLLRFARAKLSIKPDTCVTACVNGVARDP